MTTTSPQDSNPFASAQTAQLLQRTLHMQEQTWQLSHGLWRNQLATLHLLTHKPDLNLWQELLTMQGEVIKLIQAQQSEWLNGYNGLYGEYAELKKADTLSKMVEQECSLMNQIISLATTQMSGWISMLENIQRGYAGWLQQKELELAAELTPPVLDSEQQEQALERLI